MPAALSFPGVYVEEIPSGVRTITAVPTSVTAFIGRTRRGPTDEATDITSYSDFERTFGGLWLDSPMTFAVRDFFLNGGSRAVIVRLFHKSLSDEEKNGAVEGATAVADAAATKSNGKDAKTEAVKAETTIGGEAGTDPKTTAKKKAAKDALGEINKLDDAGDDKAVKAAVAKAKQVVLDDSRLIDVGTLRFTAASPGKWGGYLRVEVASAEGKGAQATAEKMGLQMSDLFNLIVTDGGPGGSSETHLNLTVKSSARRVDRVLAGESELLAWAGADLDASSPSLPDFSRVKGDAVGQKYVELLIAQREHPDPTANEVKTAKTAFDDAAKAALDSVVDGGDLELADILPRGGEVAKKGLHALEQLYTRDGIFNLLCIPPYKSDGSGAHVGVIAAASAYCEKRRAMLIVDPPTNWKAVDQAVTGFSAEPDQIGTRSKNAAIFFPRIKQPNPLRDGQFEEFAPCGVVAGVFARTDTQRGVWKAPAGIDATLAGVSSLSIRLTDEENGLLNPLGINCLRTFPIYGRIVWGARTLRGADAFADEWKYIPVRRTALFIEESLFRGLKWVVFEPNDEPLWAQIRLNVGAFMHTLFRQGAFQGASPREAYFVKCDASTTTQADINLGIVNILVGFAPLKPAEFVVIKLQQIAGQIEV